MTIALGMLCDGGAIVAADTRVILTDGSATQGEKVVSFRTDFGSVAIANAADDANAAKTLVRKIIQSVEHSPIKKWDDLEETIAYEMTQWSNAFKAHPATTFIIAACIKGVGVELYLCEPPNTVLPRPEGYAAAGGGSAVTDPLQKTLFDSSFSRFQEPQKIMRQMSYLLYRAKKDHALCGGRTSAVYVRDDAQEPEWIRAVDFEMAETQSSKLDFLLKALAQFALFSDEGDNLNKNALGIADMLKNMAGLRASVFHNPGGEAITAPEKQI